MNTDPMRGLIETFPEMCEAAWAAPGPEGFALSPGRALLFAGMGGSGMAGSLAAEWLRGERRLGLSWRNAELPEWLGGSDGLVLLSYSGKTWETLAMLSQAIARGVPARVVASGGPILARAEASGVPAFRIPAGLPPRAALPWLLAGALRAAGGPGGGELAPAIQALRDERSGAAAGRDPEAIARLLEGRLPILVPLGALREAIALRWRNQILENAEQAAFVAPLPEMAHNEVMGWGWLGARGIPATFLVLSDHWPPRGAWSSFFPALEKEARRAGLPLHSVPPSPAQGLGGILADLYLGDRVSLALAERAGVAATPVEAIARLRGAIEKEQVR